MKIRYIGKTNSYTTNGKVYEGYAWPRLGGATIQEADDGTRYLALMAGEWEEA